MSGQASSTPPKKTGKKGLTEAFKAQAGRGRPKGVPNKATSAVKDMVVQALSDAGGVEYLVARAKDNPAAFLTLVGKVIPLQVAGDLNAPITHRIELVGVMPK